MVQAGSSSLSFAVLCTLSKVNRGAGYGLEVPCVYRLYGPARYLNRLQEILEQD